MTTYISCAGTAKLLRQALKESFPGEKFSVKSHCYAGGASINIGWTDGPSSKEVEAISGRFEGAYFDGSIDYQGYKHHTLDGQEVSFGSNYIFENRHFSDALVTACIKLVVEDFGGCEPITAEDYKMGRAFQWQNSGKCDLGRALNERLSACGWDRLIQKSPTLDRVRFTGDDGYGQGTVGPNFSGGNGCNKAIEENRQRMRS